MGSCLSFSAWEAGVGVPWLQLPWEEVDSTVNFVDGWVGVSKGRRSGYWRLRPVCAVHLGRRSQPPLPLKPPPTAQSQSEGIQCDSANRVQTQRQSYAAQTLTHSKGNLHVVLVMLIQPPKKTLDMEIFLGKKSEIRPPLPSEL